MGNDTDTASRVREILDELNDRGAGAWDEFAYTLPEYDRVKTQQVYQGPGGAFVALGVIFRYDIEDGRWTMQDFGGNETWLP